MRIPPVLCAALAACTPSPQDAAMRSPSPSPTSAPMSAVVSDKTPAARSVTPIATGAQAAQGPIPEPVSAAGIPARESAVDTPAAAEGRRILSTAFVRVGPDGYLTVELRDGRALRLRNVVLRAKDYCGALPGGRHCGDYADIAAARPGGAPVPPVAPADGVALDAAAGTKLPEPR